MFSSSRMGVGFLSLATFFMMAILAVASAEEREGRRDRSSRTTYKELPPAAQQSVSYEKDVRPILMENCTRCHGAKKHKADLRLDNQEGITNGSEDGPVIKPGKSAGSMLIRSVAGIGVEADKVMPPKDDMLTKDEIGILRAWIDQGAKFDGK